MTAESSEYFRGAHMRPNADARGVLHNLDLSQIGGYQESLAEMPTDLMIDASNLAAAIRRALWPDYDCPTTVDDEPALVRAEGGI